MKRLGVHFWIILILSLIVAYMLWRYFCQFAGNGWSDDPMEWGAFGSYMGAITGLLAFVGVLASIRNANKKAEKAEKNTEELRKETQVRDERDLFFKLMESHYSTINSVIFSNKGKDDINGVYAFKEYRSLLIIYLNLLVLFQPYKQYESVDEWIKSIDQNNLFKEFFDKWQETTGESSPELKKKRKELEEKYSDVREMYLSTWGAFLNIKFILACAYELKTLMFYYRQLNLSDPICLNFMRNDNFGQYTKEVQKEIYIQVARCLENEHGSFLSYHFNNVCYITRTISKFKHDPEQYYMTYWKSKLSSTESLLFFYYLLYSEGNNDVLDIVCTYKLLDNIIPSDLLAKKDAGDYYTHLNHLEI